MDIEKTIVHSGDKLWARALFGTLKPYYAVVSMSSMDNYLLCSTLVQGLHSLGYTHNPRLIVAMGGLRDLPERVFELWRQDKGRFFLVGGNEEERVFYLARFNEMGFGNYICLPIAQGSREECESVISMVISFSAKSLGMITYEAHATRGTLTMVKAAMDANVHVPIIPIAYWDSNRYGLTKDIMAVGTMREAIKLRKWQKRGHVATLEEGMKYYRRWLDLGFAFSRP